MRRLVYETSESPSATGRRGFYIFDTHFVREPDADMEGSGERKTPPRRKRSFPCIGDGVGIRRWLMNPFLS